MWTVFSMTSPTESRISVDIETPKNILVVLCPIYIPQFILETINISCVKFELLDRSCNCHILLSYMLSVHIGSIFRICA